MSSDIGINYTLQIEVLSPLHIGNGRKLQRDFDFVAQRSVTYRLNDQTILESRWPEDESQQRKLLSGRLSDLIDGENMALHPEYALYKYAGDPDSNEINEHIKTVFGHAYMPGSSLKGALRTLLMRTIIEGVAKHTITREQIGAAMTHERDSRTAKAAAGGIETHFAVGKGSQRPSTDSNYSLFRGLEVGDSTPAALEALTLQRVLVVPGLVVTVEALRAHTQLNAPLRIDTYLLKTLAKEMGFDEKVAGTVRQFVRAAHFTAQTRVGQEIRYHADRSQTAPLGFYTELRELMQQPEFGKTTFLAQVGFLTGWRAKSVLGGLSNDSELLEQVVRDFYLDRGGKDSSQGYERGQNFPKARHLALRGEVPAEPMGWVKITATRAM
jgi:CRISPR type III-A-associated RAMP protein Csm5